MLRSAFVLLVPFLIAVLAPIAEADDAIDARARRMVEEAGAADVDWTEENSFKLAHAAVQAKFATDRDEEARAIIARAVERRPLVEYYDPEFPLWSTMDCYMRWKDVPGKYTPALKEKTKGYVAAANIPSTATTYNHHWMLASGLILAYQEWGDDIRYQFKADDPTGKKWAMNELEGIVRRSHGEDLAPTYSKFTLGPILSLYNFCDDPEIKQRAKITLDAMLLRRACFYFQGHTAGLMRRSYGQFQKADNDGGFMWLYVGGPEDLRRPATAIGLALSDYRPPAAMQTLAHDRETPCEQFASLQHNGFTEWITTYFDDTYAVASGCGRKNYLGRRSTSYHERLSWSIVWADAPDRISSFLLKQPTPKYGFAKSPYLGDSPFHQILQHKGTVIGLFDIPRKMPKFYEEQSWKRRVLGGFPMKPKAMIDESDQGRIYLDYGAVLIAAALTRPFEIQADKKRGVHFFTIDAANDADEFRVGYTVETAAPSDYDGTPDERLAAFQRAVASRFANTRVSAKDGHPYLEYECRDGSRLELGWRPIGQDTVRLIDGQPLIPEKLEEWPLMRNASVEQTLLGDTLRVTTNGETTVYDFDAWKVEE